MIRPFARSFATAMFAVCLAATTASAQDDATSRPTTQPEAANDWKRRLDEAATPEDADAIVLLAGRSRTKESLDFLERLALGFPNRHAASTALEVLSGIAEVDFVRLIETLRRVQARPDDRRRLWGFLGAASPHRDAALAYFSDMVAKDVVIEDKLFSLDCIDRILAQPATGADRSAAVDRLFATYADAVDSTVGRRIFAISRRMTTDERLAFCLAALDRTETDDRTAAAADLLREKIADAELVIVATIFRNGDRSARRRFVEGLVDHVTPIFVAKFLDACAAASLRDAAEFSRILARADLSKVEPLLRTRLSTGIGKTRIAAAILAGENGIMVGVDAQKSLLASDDAALTIAYFSYRTFVPDERADWSTLRSRLETRTDLETVEVIDIIRELGIVNSRTWKWIEAALDLGGDEFHRAAICRAAATLGYPKVGDIVGESYRSSRWQLRLAAAETLAMWEDHAATPLLIELVDDEHTRIGRIAIDALRRRYGRDCGAAKDQWKAAIGGIPARGPIAESAPTSRPTDEERYGPRFYGLHLRSNKVVFVCDCSGSMQGPKIERLKRELDAVVASLDERGAFNVVLFSDISRAIWTSIQPATKEKKSAVAKLINAIRADGGTNAYAGLSDALKDMNADTIVFLSDGQPSAGSIIEPNAILEAVEKINRKKRMAIHTIWVEQSIDATTATTTGPGSEFLRELARRNDGQFLFVGP